MEKTDFLPERIVLQRRRRARMTRQFYLLGISFACLALLGYFRHGRIDRAEAELALLQDHTTSVEMQLATRDRLEKQLNDLMVKKRIDETLGSRVNALDVLAEIQRVLPESMALSRLEMDAVEVNLAMEPGGEGMAGRTGARLASARQREQGLKRVRLILTGVAPCDVDVANFIGQLSASPLFEDVNMGYIENTEFRGRRAREFQASCYVVR